MPVIIQPSPGGGSVFISDSAGVPAGGADGQYLRKASAADYDTEWSDSTGAAWGEVTGTLADQTDLQSELDAKIATSAIGSSIQAYDADLAAIAAINPSQGDILYRNATEWSRLGAGTSGQILRTNGAGNNPAWATISGGGTDAGAFESSPTKPLLTNFTLENAGTASAADGTFGIVLTMPSATANIRFLRYTAGLPGSSWDMRLRASMITPYFTANIHHCCLLLRNSANNRIINFAQNGGNVVVQNWSSYTAFASGVVSFAAVYGPQGFWKRITCDGTNLTFYTSVNGTDWGQIGTVAIATYIGAVDQVGFGSLLGAASSVTNADVFESFTLV